MKSVYFEFDDNGKIVRCSNDYFGDCCVKFDFVDGGLKLSDGQQKRLDKMAHRKLAIAESKLAIAESKLAIAESKLVMAKSKLADAERIHHNVLSDVGKLRMAAYNDAAKWNKAVAAKFDAMIEDDSKTFFGRIVKKPIWERMKHSWMSKRLAKQY